MPGVSVDIGGFPLDSGTLGDECLKASGDFAAAPAEDWTVLVSS